MSVMDYFSSLNKFYDFLESYNKKNLSMIIGLKITNPVDMQRNIKFDIVMDYYEYDELKPFFESALSNLNPYIVFNMDLNCLCILSKGIVVKYDNINKLNKIVFDSSTFKFLSSIKLIALFYYLILEQGGTIYIESNCPMSTGFIIINQTELLNLVARNDKDGFHYQSGYILPQNIENLLNQDSLKKVNLNIMTHEKIFLQNINFFAKWFYGSSVQLSDNSTESYPIFNEHFPVTKYYKITKELPHEEILIFIGSNAKEYDTGLSLRTTSIIRM